MTKAGIGFRYKIHYTKTIGLHVIYMLLLPYAELWRCLFFIQSVPLATEPGISLIILTPMKILQRHLNSTCYDVVTFLTQ